MLGSQAVTLESGGRNGGRGRVEFIILVKGLVYMPYEHLTDFMKVNRKTKLFVCQGNYCGK